MRVALLAPCTWPEVHRGGERIHRELAAGLIARGHEPRLVTSHPGPPSRTVEDGLPVERSWRPPDGRLRRRLFEDYLTHVPFSYLRLRGGDDEIAHAFHAPDALAAARWSGETGRPAILTYLGVPHRVGLSQRRLRTEALVAAVEGCAAVTALSRTAADAFRRWLGVEARVTYPGVDLDAFAPAEQRAPEPTILCAADPGAESKRVALLVAALPEVRRSRPAARLVLMRPSDSALAARLAAEDGIELAEPVADPAELAPAYGRAWVSALPSWGESFGLVLVESLACGTPVVASRLGAIPEVVDRPEVGRLFDGDSPEDVARALLDGLELAEDGGTPPACRARAEDFSIERSTDAFEELYRELVEGRATASAGT